MSEQEKPFVHPDGYYFGMSDEEMELYLIKKFSKGQSYAGKFANVTLKKNVWSASQIVSGYKSAYGQRQRNGLDSELFNVAMFRGSAIHKYAESKLPEWYPYTNKYVEATFTYEWKDGVTPNGITIVGHPDFQRIGTVLELKTTKSADITKYGLLRKAKYQAGFYAQVLHNTLHIPTEAFTFFLNEEIITKLGDEDVLKGQYKKHGIFDAILTDEEKTRKWIRNKGLLVVKLSPDDITHGYNYVGWNAVMLADLIEWNEAHPNDNEVVVTDE